MGPVAEALVVVAFGLEELGEVRLAVHVVVQGGVVHQTSPERNKHKRDVIRNMNNLL